MDPSIDKSARQYDHPLGGLRRRDLHPDPIQQFEVWFDAAVAAGIRDVNAMSLATATGAGRPSVLKIFVMPTLRLRIPLLIRPSP